MTERPKIDDLISSVAHRLTAGDPPAHLRPRVLARLGERRSMPWMRIAASVCAAGVVIAAVASGLHDRAASRIAPDAIASGMKPASNEPLAAGTQIPAPGTQPQAPSAQRRIVGREPRVAATTTSAAELGWRARAIPALEPPEALTLTEIQPAPLELRPLVTTPLTVPAIAEIEEDDDRNQEGPGR